MTKTKIEWATDSWNPIRARAHRVANPGIGYPRPGKVGWYCEHVSDGCANCYAESMNHRLGTGLPFRPCHRKDVEIFVDEKMLLAPLRWKKPRRIFVCSMTDLFGDWVTDEWLDRIFAVMVLAPHTFQVLTKRAARMREYLRAHTQEIETNFWNCRLGNLIVRASGNLGHACPGNARFELSDNSANIAEQPPEDRKHFHLTRGWPLRHLWLGVSAEDQATADERIPLLLDTPAAVRFVNLEPLLGAIDLFHIKETTGFTFNALSKKEGISLRGIGLDWAIVGGESGPQARPMHPGWARKIRDDCAAARVPFFFKQWGEWADTEDWPSEMQEHYELLGKADGNNVRVGKKAAGRLLDGIEWNQMPEVK